MSGPKQVTPTPGARVAVALSLLLLVVGAGCLAALDGAPVLGRWDVPWPAFALLYAAFSWWTLEFVRKGESTSVVLTQLPLALGLVLLGPVHHLAARLVSAVALNGLKRRSPLKTCVNVAFEVVELTAAVLVMSLVGRLDEPEPLLWVALVAALVAAELAGHAAMQVVLRSVGVSFTGSQSREMLASSVATSVAFGGVSVLTLAALWTDPWTLLYVVLLAGALVHGYRLLRRRAAQQEVTDELHAFVKDLRPIDVDTDDALPALECVRALLHAHTVHLDTVTDRGTLGRRFTVVVNGEAPVDDEPGAADLHVGSDVRQDRMRTPVVADGTVLALLTVHVRLANERGFDPQDFRLLDTIATELATALDRGRMVADLRTAATRDPLTRLPNLRQTAADIDELLASAPLLLATVAVDSFREVNDTLGHLVGDELLCEVSQRITAACPDAVVGRIGGGRFAVAVRASDVGDDASMFGLGLRARVEGGAQLGSISTHVRLSVGCVRGPEHGADASTLLRRAETAMYSARSAHGGPVIWEPAYEVQGQRRLAVVMALREAIASNAIGVAYQPKVSAGTGRVVGVEALARWTHPALGSITPDEFIPLAEASGLMTGLTSSVLRQAVTACHGWQRRGGPVGVAVNVSSETVLDPDFVTEVSSALRSIGIAPELLTLELTESVVVADPALASERMQELRALGVRLSVDDFGTGYSSLTYLKGLPIDEVKIDKGFVAGLVSDSGDQAIVRAVVDIAHTLGVRVVAEGVEQEDQRALLTRLGVDELQGYLFARPMPALGMAAWIRRHEAVSQLEG